jgi:hypothetical protein
MQSEELDKWLYSAKAGEYTKTAIKMSDGSFMVALYVSENKTAAWEYAVKSNIYNEDYAAYEERMSTDFAASVVFNEKVINKVGA